MIIGISENDRSNSCLESYQIVWPETESQKSKIKTSWKASFVCHGNDLRLKIKYCNSFKWTNHKRSPGNSLKKNVHLKDSRHKLKTPSMRTKDKAKSPKADCCDVITSKLLKQSQAREFKLPLLPSHLPKNAVHIVISYVMFHNSSAAFDRHWSEIRQSNNQINPRPKKSQIMVSESESAPLPTESISAQLWWKDKCICIASRVKTAFPRL